MINSLKAPVRLLMRLLFRVRFHGMAHLQDAAGPTLIIANHVSFLDGILLWAFLPGHVRFAIHTHQAKSWWIKPIIGPTGLFVMDPLNPMALKGFIGELQAGHTMGIFPEGRISHTGGLMKIYPGPAMAADKADADIIAVRIDGAQFSNTSRLKGQVRQRWFPAITLTALKPRKLGISPDIKGHHRREAAAQALANIMAEMMLATSHTGQTLGQALTETRKQFGGKAMVLEDTERAPWSLQALLVKAHALGQLITAGTDAVNIGLMLPNSAAGVASFMGLQLYGRVPAMINFTAGANALQSAVATADLKVVYTSRRFIRLGELDAVVAALEEHVEVRYLEDLRSKAGPALKLRSLWRATTGQVPGSRQPDDPAVILFTSGSEGVPKGVVLSHRNLLSNCAQIRARVPFPGDSVVFNALPMFHSFGLTAGVLLPLLQASRTFLYPTPLHYKLIPEIIYDTNATVLFGSNTFLSGYARHADPYDFHHLQYVIAGAEKLQDSTRETWMDRFGIRILEGYGATETSPVLSVNTPHFHRRGSVGKLLPQVEHQFVPVPGIDDGGRLLVKGPNIMLGYLRHSQPGAIEATHSEAGANWYDTGDIARMDEDGFLYLIDRAKRFAKIGGEMVSLGRVEELAGLCWPEHQHAAVALPDPKKGERVVLLSETPDAARTDLIRLARESGFSELSIPAQIIGVASIPVLGTGKKDYAAAKTIATEH